jgi:hypothetical protein
MELVSRSTLFAKDMTTIQVIALLATIQAIIFSATALVFQSKGSALACLELSSGTENASRSVTSVILLIF